MKYTSVIIGVIIFFIVLFILILTYFEGQKGELQDKNMILKLIYTLLIGVFTAAFIGVGIAAFYPDPKFLEPPMIIKYCSPDIMENSEQSAEFKSEIEKYEQEEKAFQVVLSTYNRNVSIIALIGAIITVIASLTFFKTIMVIADGLLLGGVFTLIYGVIRGFGAEDNMFRFIVVSIGLFISLFLGYVKFIIPTKTQDAK